MCFRRTGHYCHMHFNVLITDHCWWTSQDIDAADCSSVVLGAHEPHPIVNYNDVAMATTTN